jgi:5'-methylthioadenosine phosphorylase
MPLHLRVKPGDIAERAIVVGDPERAQHLSEILGDARLVNRNRGLVAYTGYFNDVPITVATHGIGAPSMAIVAEELFEAGTRVMVRLGTAGALSGNLGPGDLVIPTAAAYNMGGLFSQYLGNSVAYPAVPSHELLLALVREFSEAGLGFSMGPVYSSDAFYAEDELPITMGRRGVLAVEMECAALFLLGLIRGFKAGAVLIISNDLREGRRSRYLVAEELRETVTKAGVAIMRTMTKLKA